MAKWYDPSEDIKICCDRMAQQLEDFRFPIDMDPTIRRYYIPYMWPHGGTYGVDYCPWCGTHLPNLKEIRDEILKKEYGTIDDTDPNVPSEFRTEEWWIKRGL